MKNLIKKRETQQALLISILISFLLHAAVISTLSLFKIEFKENKPTPKKTTLKFIKKPRLLGVKKSKSKEIAPLIKKKETKRPSLLQALGPILNNINTKAQDVQKKKIIKATPRIKKTALKRVAQSSASKKLLSNKSFNMEFTPPKGVPEDELNSFDKIYYSFLVRTYEVYLNSFMSSYNKITSGRPKLVKEVEGQQHHLEGLAKFDKEGNIISVKIKNIKSGDVVYKLFEDAIKGISSLRNPPKFLIRNEKDFTVNFVLKINMPL